LLIYAFESTRRRTPIPNYALHSYVPDGAPLEVALKRITHLGIGAHPDDLEFMAFHGIVAGYEKRSFGGVVCTDGGGAGDVSVRRQEQNRAAEIGRYGVMIQLGYSSREVRKVVGELRDILAAAQPHVVYTHNPADKHETHIAMLLAALEAMRALPREQRPARVIGCEVWRDLDWLTDEDKVVMDVSGHEELAAELHALFASQIAGRKRYDLAVAGRRRANATFLDPHATDQAASVIFGIDLTPLVHDERRDIVEYVTGFIDKFKADVEGKLKR
jgi:LmbE family N-acetylglucosaminyl deacetylase